MKYISLAILLCVFSLSSFAVLGPITGATNVCIGSNITLSDTSTGGTWSTTNTSVAQVGYTSGVVYGMSSGFAKIIYTLGGVSDTVSIYVNPYAFPIIGNSGVCVGSAITLNDSISGGVWSASNGTAIISGSVVTGVTAGIDTISYAVTYSCGTAVSKRILTINALPNTGTLSGNSNICVNATDTLRSTVSGGTWTSGNALLARIASGNVLTGVASGIVTISYTATVHGCIATTTMPVTVNALPVIGAISGSAQVCQGATGTLADTTLAGTWSASNNHASVSSSGVITGSSVGIDTIHYFKTTFCGIFSKSKYITIRALPIPGTITGGNLPLCAGATDTLRDIAPGGVWNKSGSNASVSSAGIVKGLSQGTDTIKYTVTSVYGCGSFSATKVVTINPLPTCNTITGLTSVCVGDSITLSNTTTGGVWGNKNPAFGTTSSHGAVTGIKAGQDTVVYTVTNSCGSKAVTKVVRINPLPNAGAITDTNFSSVCVGASIALIDSAKGGIWYRKNTKASVSSSGIVKGITQGLDTIKYVVNSNAGCGSDTAMTYIRVNPLPYSGNISGSSILCMGGFDSLSETVSGGTWGSTNGTNAIVSNGVVTPFNTGLDTILYIVSSAKCGDDTAQFVITIQSETDCHLGVHTVLNPGTNDINIYPNPTSENFINIEIANPNKYTNIIISNLVGQKLIEQPITEHLSRINISNLPKGCYFVVFYSNGENAGRRQFIKN